MVRHVNLDEAATVDQIDDATEVINRVADGLELFSSSSADSNVMDKIRNQSRLTGLVAAINRAKDLI